MTKAMVIVIAGFLGSGKTTLLRHLLSTESDLSRIAVVLNDFGRVGIDGRLVRTPGLEVVEMSSGCICCTLQIDLETTLHGLIESFSPARIYIEPSGIAEPSAIMAAIQSRKLALHLKPGSIITVLDADYWDAREAFGDVFRQQLDTANIILLNKIDRFPREDVLKCLGDINRLYPGTPVIPTLFCRIDPEMLNLEPLSIAPGKHGSRTTVHMNKHADPCIRTEPHSEKTLTSSGFTSFTYTSLEILNKKRFIRFLEGLPFELFRVKGFVRFPDATEMINFVGGRINCFPLAEDPGETRLVFIGWGEIDTTEILFLLSGCQ